jgi:hypothetical protein
MTAGERLCGRISVAQNKDPSSAGRCRWISSSLDLYCPAARLCVEVDGPHHAEQVLEDRERDRFLADKLILTIRFQADQVRHELDWVVRQILEEANRRIAYFEREGKPNVPEF